MATEVLSPYTVLIAMPFVVGAATQERQAEALWWAAALAVFSSFIPWVLIMGGALRGRWEGHHVRNREGRRTPLIICGSSVIAVTVLMAVFDAPSSMQALGVAELVLLAVTVGVTFGFKWKISIHAAVASAAALVTAVLYGLAWHWLWLLVLLVGWSRVRVNDHDLPQVIGGTLLGLVGGALFVGIA
ncbi:phosphatase PAP2 family protein [Allokutzneria multivorans]|uniref:phosphatase PAP2 family protein n=1 Tax=Allokutzneria multivorans TaxID=1142134 RepID=UPI0031ECD578